MCGGAEQDGMWQKRLTLWLCACCGCSREGNEPGDELTVTYRELLRRVCRFANVLKSQGAFNTQRPLPVAEFSRFQSSCRCCVSAGVKKGDRVSIYMPMVVELVVAMLACVRIGAVHSIVVSLVEHQS